MIYANAYQPRETIDRFTVAYRVSDARFVLLDEWLAEVGGPYQTRAEAANEANARAFEANGDEPDVNAFGQSPEQEGDEAPAGWSVAG